jgi:hypothetical protein
VLDFQRERAAPTYEALDALPDRRTWRRVVVVVDGPPDGAALSLASALAERDGATVILFDLTADSFWASPFPPGEGVRPVLLTDPDLRRVGRHALADAMVGLQSGGVNVLAHVSMSSHGDDLPALVESQRVDLVICPVPLKGKLARSVHRSRRAGAGLLVCSHGEATVFWDTLAPDEPLPVEERVQFRYLAALVITFLVAGFRNRSRS